MDLIARLSRSFSRNRDLFIRMSQLSGLNHLSELHPLWAGATVLLETKS
jgi:hypothetical protein